MGERQGHNPSYNWNDRGGRSFVPLHGIHGDGVAHLSMDDRFAMANMAIEAGAKNGIFEVDEKTIEYVKEHSTRQYKVYKADEDAEYVATYEIDLSQVKPRLRSRIFRPIQEPLTMWAISKSTRL